MAHRLSCFHNSPSVHSNRLTAASANAIPTSSSAFPAIPQARLFQAFEVVFVFSLFWLLLRVHTITLPVYSPYNIQLNISLASPPPPPPPLITSWKGSPFVDSVCGVQNPFHTNLCPPSPSVGPLGPLGPPLQDHLHRRFPKSKYLWGVFVSNSAGMNIKVAIQYVYKRRQI